MKKRKPGKSGSALAKSMVQIPLYRSRVEKSLHELNQRRPSKHDLIQDVDKDIQ